MSELRSLLSRLGAVALGLTLSTPAWALPWDIDLVDAYYYRGYEWKMMDVPEGAVSRNMWVANADRMTPEGQALTSPYPTNEAFIAKGERMFDVYCATCHGAQGLGGAEVANNESGKRYPVMPPRLSGDGNSSALRPDGYIYLTIRNGGAIMPSYGAAMNDDEMWAVVAYIRTLEGAAYNGGS